MDVDDTKVESFAQKVRHYLISYMSKTSSEATDDEFYRAFVAALKEELMINWTATNHTFKKKGLRKLYYLSMEYMPGRLFENNITNIGTLDFVKGVFKKLNRDFVKIKNIERDVSIGNGGLGRLASCFLDSLATLEYPAMGYGLRYQYGIFEQELICGNQFERPDCWLLTPNPWEFRKDCSSVNVKFSGKPISRKNSHGDEVFDIIDYEEVRALPYDFPIIGYSKDSNFPVLTLRLWSTKESPRNFGLQKFNAGDFGQASENTCLTDVLYPNDNHDAGKRVRLKQEFLLSSASLQDIVNQYQETYSDWKEFPNMVRIQINDTHPTLIIPEMIHLLTRNHDMSWNSAWEIVKTCCGYTNHTVLKEALEEWNVDRIFELLPRHYFIIERLNQEFCQSIRKTFKNDEEKIKRMSFIENGQIKMANLALYGCHKVNGVAALHTEILKASIFRDFFEMYPNKFVNITNGITQRRWLLNCNPLLAKFITERIGNGWITHFEEIGKIKEFASDPVSQNEFLKIKKTNKQALLEMIKNQVRTSHGDTSSYFKENLLDTTALFDVQIKRIHEYKRQLMKALHLVMLYHEIKANPNSHRIKRFSIFSGKAAPGYEVAKAIIRFIYCLSRVINKDPVVGKRLKICFIENYNVSNAEVIIPGTDLSEQISTAGMEASGTGNMKFAINGALTIATDDGANVEMREKITDEWWPFIFGASSSENLELIRSQSYQPFDLLEKNPQIKKTVESLIDGSFSKNKVEAQAFELIFNNLKEDRFFVLNDLYSYYETQKKVETLYKTPNKWAEHALNNIGGMGYFSSDVSIRNYAEKIWSLKNCPVDSKEIVDVRKEYTEHDRCYINPQDNC